MKSMRYYIPTVVTLGLAAAALWHGPIAQLDHYHDFADQQTLLGIPHFGDVVSNIGFALLALIGWINLAPARNEAALRDSWPGYRLFLIGLCLTAFGSTYYHLAPDNSRLVWDRLPIALACGGLLSGVWSDVRQKRCNLLSAILGLLAIFSVAWWHYTEQSSAGDLRPYLLLQVLPIILIPLWQWLYDRSKTERISFAWALVLYVVAKVAEVNDHQIAAWLGGGLTGHTLKHLLATLAAATIVMRLVHRLPDDGPSTASRHRLCRGIASSGLVC